MVVICGFRFRRSKLVDASTRNANHLFKRCGEVFPLTMDEYECGELKIPTSYGFIAAKTWKGKPDINDGQQVNILAVHGWQDNAGTFDRLFPLLPLRSLYIVAVDLPGHGASSHLPKGIPYTDITWVMSIRHVLEHLGWKQNVTIVAHSMGANASLEFAALYPDVVVRLLMLDTIKHRIFEPENLAKEMADSITRFVTGQRFPVRPEYRFERSKAIEMVMETHLNGVITRDAAQCLLARAVNHHIGTDGAAVGFRRDPRLNQMIYRKFDKRQLLAYLSGIRCRLMILRATNTHHTLQCRYEKDFLELYQTKCEKFDFIKVNGDHYVHLTNPSAVADHVNRFICEALPDQQQI